MTVERNSNRRIALTRQSESAYNTACVDGDMNICGGIDIGTAAIIDRFPKLKDNSHQLGRNTEHPTSQDIELWDVKAALQADMTSDLAAVFLALAMGAVTTSNPELDAYSHAITPMSDAGASTLQLFSTSIVEQLTSGKKDKYSGLCVDEIKLTGAMGERIRMDVTFIGSGERVTSTLSMPAFAEGSYLRWSGLKLQYGVAASEVDLSSRLVSIDLSYKNNLQNDDGYAFNGGAYKSRLRFGTRECTIQFVVTMDNALTYWTDMENQVANKLILTATGAALGATTFHSLVFTAFKMMPVTRKVSESNGLVAITMDDKVMYDSVNSKHVTATVQNGTAVIMDAST